MKNTLVLIISFCFLGSLDLIANSVKIVPEKSMFLPSFAIVLIALLTSFLVSRIVYRLLLKFGGKARKHIWRMSIGCLIVLMIYLIMESAYHPFFELENVHGYKFKELVHLSTAAIIMFFGCIIGYKLSPVKRLYY